MLDQKARHVARLLDYARGAGSAEIEFWNLNDAWWKAGTFEGLDVTTRSQPAHRPTMSRRGGSGLGGDQDSP